MNIDVFSYLNNNESKESVNHSDEINNKLSELQIVKLEPISIPSTATPPQHIVNLKQSFTFPAVLKPSNQMSTQTSQISLAQNRVIIAGENATNGSLHGLIRTSSLPPESVALTNLAKRVQADVKPKILKMIGDGDKLIGDRVDCSEKREPDLELADSIAPTPVQCVMIKPK